MKKSLKGSAQSVVSPLAAAVISVDVELGQAVVAKQIIATVESMKMQTALVAPVSGVVLEIGVTVGQTVQTGHVVCKITEVDAPPEEDKTPIDQQPQSDGPLEKLNQQLHYSLDSGRQTAVNKRHAKGYRTARENLAQLCDTDSFVEYGQLAVAAQRDRISAEDLKVQTAADGVITGLATINSEQFGSAATQVAVIVNDYTVLAGTQGYFHHRKIDRMLK
ncbi:MAG: biotin carboxylase, partial [Porticoccaceae bacterium]|nr:biotin carboxylase [Porticoccaceae bacterium]